MLRAVTDQEFAELLALQHELPAVEFKPDGARGDKTLFHSVAKAILGMANRRDGGRIVLGVREDQPGKLERVGLTEAQAATWRHDELAAAIAPVADPYVTFEVEEHRYEDTLYLVVDVREFEEVPVICRRDYPPNLKAGQKAMLRAGAVYVRTRRIPETTEIPSQTEMRELIELATEKRMRSLLGTIDRAGLEVRPKAAPDEQFLAELPEDLR
jgi:predicted HTH transcriptional regulator